MSNKLYEETDVQAIANAIRSKNGSSDTYMVSEMAQAVLDIPQGTTPTGTKQITIDSAGVTTENVSAYANVEITVPQGQYKPNIDATPTNPSITVSNGGLITAEVQTQYVNDLLKPSFTEGYIESSDVSMTVKIGGSATQQMNTVNGQTVTPTTSQQNIAVQGDYVLGAINVAPIPSQYIIPTGTKQITANGTGIDVKSYEYVDVSVSGGGGGGSDMIAYLYYTGSGVDKTSIGFDCMNHDAYYTIPFDSTSSYIVSGATASTQGLKIYDTRLYSDAQCTNLVGYYQVDTGTIAQTARTITNCPFILLDTEYKVCPKGYYGKIVLARSGTDLFSSNGNVLSYINQKGTQLKLKYSGSVTTIDAEGEYSLDENETVNASSGYNGIISVAKTKTLIHSWDFKTGLTDSVGSLSATLSNGATQGSTGVSIGGATQCISIPVEFKVNRTYEIDVASISKAFSSGHGRLFMIDGSQGFIAQNGSSWKIYSTLSGAWSQSGASSLTDLSGKTVSIVAGNTFVQKDSSGTYNVSPISVYIDGVLFLKTWNSWKNSANLQYMKIGYTSASFYNSVISGFRIYDGVDY